VKFQIQRELGAKPEISEDAKTSKYTPRLTEWLVPTLLLVGVEEYSDGRQAESFCEKVTPSEDDCGSLLSVFSIVRPPPQLSKNSAF
jgi:hypothetical protein